LRVAVLARDQKRPLSRPNDLAHVEHSPGSGVSARVTVLNTPESPLAKPRFLVVLDARAPASARPVDLSAERMKHLRDLTQREREIALLVCEGQSNAEIAQVLSKSVLTIKTQLNSVFRKLGVKSRARLMAQLR
jgi:DNA-binding CsgD family transcriptional regulator